MMKSMMSVGLVIFGIMTALPVLADGDWELKVTGPLTGLTVESNTSCLFVLNSKLDSNTFELESNWVPCKVKYTSYEDSISGQKTWDILFTNDDRYMFVWFTFDKYIILLDGKFLRVKPILYTRKPNGHHCWESGPGSVNGAAVDGTTLCYKE